MRFRDNYHDVTPTGYTTGRDPWELNNIFIELVIYCTLFRFAAKEKKMNIKILYGG